jgi:hypothetical protein
MADCPEPGAGKLAGENLTVIPAGSEVAEKDTAALKAFDVTMNAFVATFLPGATVRVVEERRN